MKRKIVIGVLLMFMFSACTPNNTPNNPNEIIRLEGQYAMVNDFVPSPNRIYHGTTLPIHQALEVGARLLAHSKAHFSVDEYYLQEGRVITLSHLSNLVRRESPTNPIGLNPPSGSLFPSGTGVDIADSVIVSNVLEVNFMQRRNDGFTLAGMAVAIVLNPLQSVGTSQVRITNERLFEYGSDMGRRLESFLRTLPGVGNIPIFITLYSVESVDAILPGGMIGSGLFLSRSGQITPLRESWIILPSAASNTIDPLVHNVLLQLRSNVQTLLPEAIGLFGRARVVNDVMDAMIIDVNTNVRTYTELQAVTHLILSELQAFESRSLHIKVHIRNMNSTLVLIEKKANDDDFTIIYLH